MRATREAMEVTLEIYKRPVYTEVAQTSSYTGAKMDDDENAYDRIFTTDEDESQLERFWNESCVTLCEALKRYLTEDSEIRDAESGAATGHRFEMEFSRSFDAAMLPSMRQELFSYFVMSITAKWFGFSNKKEAPEYAGAAAALLEGIHRKACFKRKPTRPTYN